MEKEVLPLHKLWDHEYEWVLVCTPPPLLSFCWVGLNLQPNFQKVGFDRASTFRGGDFFQGVVVVQFSHKKNKIWNVEIFNDKNSL